METLYLVGCPNVGKSTLFTALSGKYASTGNRAGVTVEAQSAVISLRGQRFRLTDLPGIRRLPPRAPDEIISVAALENAPDAAALFVADAAHPEEGLTLLSRLRADTDESRRAAGRAPLCWILILNGIDRLPPGTPAPGAAPGRERFPQLRGIPTVAVSALRRKGLDSLTALLTAGENSPAVRVSGEDLPADRSAGRKTSPAQGSSTREHPRPACPGCCAYCLAAGGEGVSAAARAGWRERADALLTRPATGVPILILVWVSLLLLAFGAPGNALCLLCRRLLSLPIGAVTAAAQRLPPAAASFVTQGLLGGVGCVLDFLPRLLLLWIGLSALEESGYLPRAAALAQPFMHRLGLSGQALIPLLLGFGCSVPAALTTRTLDDANIRTRTLCLIPSVTCSARLPLLSLLAEAFFATASTPGVRAWQTCGFILSLYALSTLVTLSAAALSARIEKRGQRPRNPDRADTLPGAPDTSTAPDASAPASAPSSPVLPDLRFPSPAVVLRETEQRLRHFLCRVGGVILLSSVLVWLLLHVTPGMRWSAQPAPSCLLFSAGRAAGVLLRPIGLDAAPIAAALLAGLCAKELILSVLALCLTAGDPAALPSVLAASGWLTKASALALAVFAALYTPCTAALGALWSEAKGRRRALIRSLLASLLTAYFAAWAAFSLFRLLPFS